MADAITGGPIAPPTTLSVWFRPHYWEPGATGEQVALQVHFDLKEALRPARGGDDRQHDHLPRAGPPRRSHQPPPGPPVGQRAQDHQARHRPVLGDRRRVPQPATTSWWASRPTPASATGATGARHDRDRAHPGAARPGGGGRRPAGAAPSTSPPPPSCSARWPAATGGRCTTTTSSPSSATACADIFLNTPNQAAWFERYVTDWTGPTGRLGRMTFRMRDSVFPGDRMVFAATVTAT